MPKHGPTTDHHEIFQWAQSQQACPAEIVPFVYDSKPTILRFIFGEIVRDEPELHRISWDAFFAKFDLFGMQFVYEVDEEAEPTGEYRLTHPADNASYPLQEQN